MKVEILYFEGCPNHRPTVDLVKAIMAEGAIPGAPEEIEVRDPAEAERLRFLGSPTVRVNGVDIDPDAEGCTDYALSCRTYAGSGIPPREAIARALADSEGG